MRRAAFVTITLIFALVPVAIAGTPLQIVPATTLSTETGNNTSTSNLFVATSNGNLGPGNVSKVNTHALMYPGYNGKIFVHQMGWFCMQPGSTATGAGTQCNQHVQIGYNSADPAVVHAQVEDMISRGFDGVVHIWYGPGNMIDNATKALMNEAQQHPGFSFSIMIDQGAIRWNSCYTSGCTATQALTQLTQYLANTYFISPAYTQVNGRPLLGSFAIDSNFSVDWNYVAANTPDNPAFYFQNNGGFTHTQTSGAFSWVMPTDSNYGLDYLGSFYSTGMNYPAELTLGAIYKGFNDTLASWSANRIMSQQCGQTWLETFAKANSMYNSSKQLGAIQLVTWDDYEEGTPIETGIDNCFSLSGAMSGNTLQWTISGDESTIDHYTVFISTDGQNLMPLGDFATGTLQLDLSTFALDPGAYTLYVKATGKPSLRNQMSGAVSYSIGANLPNALLSLSATSAVAPATITASTSGSTDPNSGGTITFSTINWGDGTSTVGSTASHAYTTAGVYTVSATVTDNYGWSSSTSQSLTIKAPYIVITSPANGATVASPVQVIAQSYSGNPISSYIVYVDYVEVYRTYTTSLNTKIAIAAGQHLFVINSWDSTSTLMQAKENITVANGPTAVLSLSATSGIAPVTITASTSASTDPNATISSSTINWGDGSSSAGPSASHTYSAPGGYSVTTTVTDSLGLSNTSAAQSVAVQPAKVTISSPGNGTTVSSPFQVMATAVSGNTISSMTVYLDGTVVYTVSGASVNTSITAAPGGHTVMVKATDSAGMTMQSSVSVTVASQQIVPSLTVTVSPTSPLTMTASTVGSTDPNAGATLSPTISWGDGATSTGNTATHTYAKPGVYTVSAIITDNFGLSASTSTTVTANGVLIKTPTNGALVNSPVEVAATAYDSKKITSMTVYVDNAKKYTIYSNSLDTTIKMRSGTRTIVVNAWEDVTGVLFQARVTVTVP